VSDCKEIPARLTRNVRHGEAYRHFSAIIGWKGLTDSVEHFGQDHQFTKLVPDLKGKDPDDAFSKIPYEKGFNFLFHLENLLTKERFDRFIPHVGSVQ
jgi:leukotriene-A4 hydrolase